MAVTRNAAKTASRTAAKTARRPDPFMMEG